MANGHGGKRAGSGRKKKPLAEKILDGNPGKRTPKVLDMPEQSGISLKPPDWLVDFPADVLEVEPDINTLYTQVVTWLQGTGCLHLINPEHILDYVRLKFRWLECEEIVRVKLIKCKVNGDWGANPMYQMGLDYQKAANAMWDKIWAVVAQNCETDFSMSDPNNDIMESLLRGRG